MKTIPQWRAFVRPGLPFVALAIFSGLVTGCFDSMSPNVDSSSVDPALETSPPSTAFETEFRATFDRVRATELAEGGETDEGSLARASQTLESLHGGFEPITGPTVITSPGMYRVVEDFKITSEDAIVVRSDFVWLDLHTHAIGGSGNKIGHGVLVEDSRYVFVGKGSFNTFGVGVALVGSSHCLVTGNRVQGGDEFADPPTVPPQVGFLMINSAHNVLFGNRANLVNLGYFVRGGESTQNLIARNQAVGGENGLLAVCYNPAEGEGDAGPHHDLVRRNLLSRFDTGIQTMTGAAENRFVRNVIEYFVQPWEDFNGSNLFIDNETIQL